MGTIQSAYRVPRVGGFIEIWFTRLWGVIYPIAFQTPQNPKSEVCEIECDLPDFRFLQSRKYATNSYLRARRSPLQANKELKD